MTGRLGFRNTYALGMKRDHAKRLHIRKISDLKKHPDLRLGFSNEFLKRQDGWETQGTLPTPAAQPERHGA